MYQNILKKIMSSVCMLTIFGGICLAGGPDSEFLKSAIDKYVNEHPGDTYLIDRCNNFVRDSEKIINHVSKKGYKLTDKILGFGYNGICFLAKNSAEEDVVLKFTRSDCHKLRCCKQYYLGDEIIYNTLNPIGIALPLNSCHILDFIKLDEPDEEHFDVCVVMSYVRGENLRSYIDVNKFNSSDVINWIKTGIKPILDVFHANNLIHNDVASANMILTSTGIVLIDYGKAITKDLAEKMRRDARSDKNFNLCLDQFINLDLNGLKQTVECLLEHENHEENTDNKKLQHALTAENFEDFYKTLE